MIVSDFDEWKDPKSRESGQYMKDTDSSLITPQKFNKSSDIGMLIFSHPLNRMKRDMIRFTWGNKVEGEKSITMAFLLGASSDKKLMEAVMKEALMYKDILLENFQDTYRNLTVKSLRMLKFANQNLRKDSILFEVRFQQINWLIGFA